MAPVPLPRTPPPGQRRGPRAGRLPGRSHPLQRRRQKAQDKAEEDSRLPGRRPEMENGALLLVASDRLTA